MRGVPLPYPVDGRLFFFFNAALFTIARTWKQPKCPLTEEDWIKKIWCIYTREYYSAIKKKKK